MDGSTYRCCLSDLREDEKRDNVLMYIPFLERQCSAAAYTVSGERRDERERGLGRLMFLRDNVLMYS
ncbi:hypothetical protein HYC85_014869 [Camellia sinensis]|uniref:Uncharacterized protein n=1 Tax=Camellia sinensis TaxID=4442 RepID=A0A7J7H7I3_CAMSI|nr:hypothetical protein HYC85_014869 [Camellia sinensis]